MIRAAIAGGSGYGASELLRLSLSHPELRVVRVTSRKLAGRKVGDVHRFLNRVVELEFESADPGRTGEGVDLVFVSLPHGAAGPFVAKTLESHPDVRLIDLSGDFRLGDPRAHSSAYPETPPYPELRKSFVYGLPELFRDRILGSRRIANPGCFATGAILALAPLAAKGLLAGPVVVDGKSGSSCSGVEPGPKTHHPERVGLFAAYSPLSHRHVPEIEQALEASGARARLTFVPHSTPLVRGIYTTAYVPNPGRLSARQALDIHRAFYEGEPFVRVLDGPPDAGVVAGSNFADLHVTANDDTIVLFSAIDNLVKGAAGQAIQNMNLLFGLDERTGLLAPGARP